MLRTLSALTALCALSGHALAQANDPNAPSQYQSPPQPQPPPAQYQPPPQQAQPPPQQSQPPPQQSQPPPQAQGQPPQQGTAQPPPSAPAGGGGSQQVVVNPPAGPASTPPPPPPPAPNTAVNVNPPAPGYGQSNPPVVVERQVEPRSSLEIVAIDAAYGALAGLLVGGGVALIANNDDWGRDLMIGTGAGIIVGAAVGGIHAYNVADRSRSRYARDGLGTPDRSPPLASVRTVVGYAARF